MVTICWKVACFFLLVCLPGTIAQFPRVCTSNATTADGICCPIRPGDVLPCGGPERGMCRDIGVFDEIDLVPADNKLDDRFNWPSRFFKKGCDCRGNFGGFMCQRCTYGFTGPQCTQKLRRVRKDYRKLTAEEKDDLMRGINLLTQTESYYAVLDTSNSADPTDNPQFVNVTMYDYLAYFHYYVARRTLLKPMKKCQEAKFIPDFAHGGPVFGSWHRAFLLQWEMEIAKILNKPEFAFPYWNWTESGSKCDVCTNDFMGHTPVNSTDGTLDPKSMFYSYSVKCVPSLGGCNGCNPQVSTGKIIRRPGGNPEYPTLPSKEDMDYIHTVHNYDTFPYTSHSGNQSFRNLLEGFGSKHGYTGRMFTHNQVHAFMDGTFSVLVTAAFDPVFQLHHAFVDKHFEMWIRKNRPALTELPEFEAPAGHSRLTNMVPFFPVERNFEFFTDSTSLGYDYDDLVEQDINTRTQLSPVWIIVIVEAGLVLLLLVIVFELARSRRAGYSRRSRATSVHSNASADANDEEQPIFTPGNPNYKTYNAAQNS